MVDPFIYWDPSLLRRIGISLLIIGLSVLIVKPLEDLGMNGRLRLVFALSLGGIVYTSWQQNPTFEAYAVMLSAALGVLIPLLVCFNVFRSIARGS